MTRTSKRTGWPGRGCGHWIEDTRRAVGVLFDKYPSTTSAAILRALIIGDKSRLDPELRDSFTRVGVAHVLAISGLHIGLVALLAYGAWWWLLARSQYLLLMWSVPKLAASLTLPVVLLYAGLAGGSVSTLRAVIMVAVFLTARLLDREEEVFRSLALAALIVSLIWPGAVLDISFQLSFVAVLAIFLGLYRFRIWRDNRDKARDVGLSPWHRQLRRWAGLYGLVSLSATVGTLPLVATHFHTVPLVGFVANLLVVPFLEVPPWCWVWLRQRWCLSIQELRPWSCGVPESWSRSACGWSKPLRPCPLPPFTL